MSDPTVFAHRGCPARGPENTVAAFRRAAARVPAVELDARRCGSGELVVFHDDTLDRLLGLDGRVAETSLDRLQSRGVLDSDERVPTLSTALAAIPDDVTVNVELKETGIADGVARAVAAVDNEVLVSSFSRTALSEYAAVADDPRAFVTVPDEWESAVETAADDGCVALHPQYETLFVGDDDRVETARRRIETAHDHGLAVNVWTIRSPDPVADLRAAGVDGLIADDWADAGVSDEG
ncbi:glycerophosphodiester phosphodiesterase [Halobaculum sp. MBLA0143]|uniref:glycerophosphodiester phosphodiesterase n=1 Tax=Halobaculum sp. MBLA0143 TaxID=3079933 RepID=UPI0035264E8F